MRFALTPVRARLATLLSAAALVGAIAAPSASATTTTSLNLYGAPTSAAAFVAQYPALKAITTVPQASWLGSDWSPNPAPTIRAMATRAAGRTLQLVVYGIPDRDNGGYSSGGAVSESAYYAWVGAIAYGIGNSPAIVVLEPDALGLSLQLADPTAAAARVRMLSTAVIILKSRPHAKVYIDASSWIGPGQQAQLLRSAGVSRADGFALNTSGYESDAFNFAYGNAVSALIGGKHYVVDTSRNGQGAIQGQWCNPPGRGLGALPQRPVYHPLADALLWIKHPGESDGPCNGGPGAGQFWPAYAAGLVTKANYAVG